MNKFCDFSHIFHFICAIYKLLIIVFRMISSREFVQFQSKKFIISEKLEIKNECGYTGARKTEKSIRKCLVFEAMDILVSLYFN